MSSGQPDALIEEVSSSSMSIGALESEVLLSPLSGRLLEQSLSRDERRKGGVFFSGLELSDYVANRVRSLIESGASVADPTCGGGDLLLACLRLFQIGARPAETAKLWADRIKGYDLQPSFVEAARLRMAALVAATHEGEVESLGELSATFIGIARGDYLENAEKLSNIDVIVANPPFGSIEAPEGCEWSTGKTQRAAVFLDRIVHYAKPGQNIVAILPDVLRSGTRYKRWRGRVERDCDILEIHRYGRFGESADIDVFVIHVRKRSMESPQVANGDWVLADGIPRGKTVSSSFDVSIGPLVPHRYVNVGSWCYYLDVSGAPANGEVNSLPKKRFSGKVIEPPFVVVRRTSSPSDKQRVVATLVNTDGPVAVENHLVILSPKKGGLAACRELTNLLKTKEVHEWVNAANGCRHLTKGLVESIPIEGIP